MASIYETNEAKREKIRRKGKTKKHSFSWSERNEEGGRTETERVRKNKNLNNKYKGKESKVTTSRTKKSNPKKVRRYNKELGYFYETEYQTPGVEYERTRTVSKQEREKGTTDIKRKEKSHRRIYKKDGKYYTTHKVGKLGGKEREISEKRYNRLSKKMDRRQKRFKK